MSNFEGLILGRIFVGVGLMGEGFEFLAGIFWAILRVYRCNLVFYGRDFEVLVFVVVGIVGQIV